MPKLYLLRHAQAENSFGTSDKERPLSEHGISQSNMIGYCLDKIDLVLCSSARRTRMTLEAIESAKPPIQKTEFSDNLYNASAEDMFEIIQQQNDKNIMVIAHNPGIQILANMLAGDGENLLLNKLSSSYSPGTLSVFDCHIEQWAELKPKANRLIDLIIPH